MTLLLNPNRNYLVLKTPIPVENFLLMTLQRPNLRQLLSLTCFQCNGTGPSLCRQLQQIKPSYCQPEHIGVFIGYSKTQLATLRLDHHRIDTETRAYVGISRQRNVAQALLIVVLNETGDSSASDHRNTPVHNVAIGFLHPDISIARKEKYSIDITACGQ